MRLICPNCNAQYEVDDSAIPASGRDVQCSNCGTAWFQKSAADMAAEVAARRASVAAAAAAAGSSMEWSETAKLAENPAPVTQPAATLPTAPSAAEPEPMGEPAAVAEPAPEVDPVPPVASAPEPQSEPETAAEPTNNAAEADGEATAPVMPHLRRRAIDETTLSVLREEAERETQARQDEGTSLLVEPAASAIVEPVERSLETRAAPAPDPDDRQARKELLPDIEQINSTLRATADRAGEAVSRDAPQMLRRQRTAFRFGFITAVTTIAVLVLVYAFAPTIVRMAPETEASMINYVATIDGLRGWFESMMVAATQAMGGTTN